MDYAKNKEYWKKTSLQQSHSTKSLTHSDPYLPKLETDAIEAFIDPKDNVLEFGCGPCDNALSYMKKANSYIGVEFMENFTQLAKDKINQLKVANSEIIQYDGFEYARDMMIESDTIITQRFIINLRDRETQISFFKNLKENAKTKFKMIICEGFLEELENLNKLRSIIGLSLINVAEFNNFLDKDFIDDIVKIGFERINEIKFNNYFYITRLFNNPEHLKEGINLNEEAYKIEKSGFVQFDFNISYSKVIVLKLL